MLLKILVFAFLSLGYVSFANISTPSTKPPHISHCEHLNNIFAESSNQFLSCALKHNEIATYCLNCTAEYSQFLISYDALVKGNDTHGDCRSRFIDNNQLDIVESIYENAKRLWDSGLCSGEINFQRHFCSR